MAMTINGCWELLGLSSKRRLCPRYNVFIADKQAAPIIPWKEVATPISSNLISPTHAGWARSKWKRLLKLWENQELCQLEEWICQNPSNILDHVTILFASEHVKTQWGTHQLKTLRSFISQLWRLCRRICWRQTQHRSYPGVAPSKSAELCPWDPHVLQWAVVC